MPISTSKRYRCKRCGHETMQTTNHHGPTWSFGRYNVCPSCPPWSKYPEFGGGTIWECMEPDEYILMVDGEILSQGTYADMEEKAATMEHMGFFGPEQMVIKYVKMEEVEDGATRSN